MNTFNFTTFLTSNIEIERQYLDTLLNNCKVKQVAKGEYLIRVGEHCHHSFFVEKGLLRQFSIDDKGKEHIIQFAPENWFVTDRESVYFDQPSKFFIQAIEDSTVLFLEEHFIATLAQQDKAFGDFNNRLLHNHIRHLQKRINLLLSASAEERYLDFIKTYPDVLLRVPQTMVASYLGITPESLSRVRKELASRHK